MSVWPEPSRFTLDALRVEAGPLLKLIARCPALEAARERLFQRVTHALLDEFHALSNVRPERAVRIRDCVHTWLSLLSGRADARSGFSVAGALWDIARGVERPELTPGFHAELIHLFWGLEGRGPTSLFGDEPARTGGLEGREAACARSDELDLLWAYVETYWRHYPSGLEPETCERRRRRRTEIAGRLGSSPADWTDWRWQTRNVVKDPELLARLIPLDEDEAERIRRLRQARVPFGVTPHYLSLIDETPGPRDQALRAQVLPPRAYTDEMVSHKGERERACDFMLECDTSPIDLVTRRYPAIVILKPYNTCPQICVYCQRNWEIEDAMAAGARAAGEQVDRAIDWIAAHPAICEVLITGGDPLMLEDAELEHILERLAAVPHLDMIRIGSRTPVTLPMRFTSELVELLARFREPGRREVALVTHVQHPYEINPDMVAAVDRLRRHGIAVYNQLVYTFYTSRRFEAARLRMLLRRIGIDPYYTFMPKGKDEARDYRVPMARLLQEQKEEARLLPGTRRTDEAVFNVPGLGKNMVRAAQHRSLLSILPDGSRVYEYHPWEKKIVERETFLSADVPILDYLRRLAEIGENPGDYASIWYYY